MGRVVRRLGDRAAHQSRRAEHAVESCVVRPSRGSCGGPGPRRRRAGLRRRRARSPPRHWSGCRACPSAARSGSLRCGRSTRKQESPAGACASTRNASDIGAEQNHLWPSRYQASPSAARDRLVGADIGATLAFGHRHPAQRALAARQASGSSLPPRARAAPAERHGGERHRERTADACLDLRRAA